MRKGHSDTFKITLRDLEQGRRGSRAKLERGNEPSDATILHELPNRVGDRHHTSMRQIATTPKKANSRLLTGKAPQRMPRDMNIRVTEDMKPPSDQTGDKGDIASEDKVTVSDQFRETLQNLRLGVSMLWEAFKTYFAISTILFTALAFLNTIPSKRGVTTLLSSEGRRGLSIGIALIGILISVLGHLAIRRFIKYQASHLQFGATLEREPGLVANIQGTWTGGYFPATRLTAIVFLAFGLLWCGALTAVWPAPSQTSQSQSVSTDDSAAAHDGGAR